MDQNVTYSKVTSVTKINCSYILNFELIILLLKQRIIK